MSLKLKNEIFSLRVHEMARIRTPKSFSKLMEHFPADKVMPLLGKYGATDGSGNYLQLKKV